jgi:hypothetical protein
MNAECPLYAPLMVLKESYNEGASDFCAAVYKMRDVMLEIVFRKTLRAGSMLSSQASQMRHCRADPLPRRQVRET